MRLLLRKKEKNKVIQVSDDCTKDEVIGIAIAWGASYWILVDDDKLIDDGFTSTPE